MDSDYRISLIKLKIKKNMIVRKCIFFILHRTFKRAIVQEYTESVVVLNDISERSEECRDVEFRMFFGWAIHSVIDGCCNKKHYIENGRKLELLRNLRKLEKTFTSKESDSASSIWKTLNKGGLCYPKDELKDFSITILDIIAKNMNVEVYGNEAFSKVHDILQENILQLQMKWDFAILNIEQETQIKFDKDISRNLMTTIISKVLHARANVFVKAYREKTTSRFARSKASALTGDVNFRTSLKIIQPKQKVTSSKSHELVAASTILLTNSNEESKNKKQKNS
jgi:hypothetical protein